MGVGIGAESWRDRVKDLTQNYKDMICLVRVPMKMTGSCMLMCVGGGGGGELRNVIYTYIYI